jgi:hypothetical protein
MSEINVLGRMGEEVIRKWRENCIMSGFFACTVRQREFRLIKSHA